jgi:CheY-like chemotaxis protein
MLRRMLEKAGAEVEIATDGLAAVQAAEARRFDAIVMDLQMPHLDGIGATLAIRDGAGPNARTPIIGLTATVGEEQERKCRAAGMDAYLTKPVDRPALLAALGLAPGGVTGPGPAA